METNIYKKGMRSYTLHYVKGSDTSKTYANQHPIIKKMIEVNDQPIMEWIKNEYPLAKVATETEFYSQPYGQRNDSLHMIDTPYGKHSYLTRIDLGFKS
jgi:hypothetical protein